MDALVQIVFFGEVLEGFPLDDVKRRVGQLLKLDDAKLAHLFSGARTVLKRSVAQADAQRYAEVLAKAGARIRIEPQGTPAQARPAAPPAGRGFPSIQLPPDVPRPAPPPPASPAPIPAAARPAPPKVLELAPLAAPVEDEVACPNCGERQSRRLLCRACSTNIEMAMAAKLERENAAREAKQDELLARQAMRAGSASRSAAPGVFGFGMSGRMGRLKYATAHAWMWALVLFLAVPVVEKPSIGRILFFLLGLAVIAFMSMRQSVLRCHDCNKTGWWTLLTFVPTANFLLGLVLSFAPGTPGENDYGEEPPSASWGMLAIAVLVLAVSFGFLIKGTIHAVRQHAEDREEFRAENESFDARANSLPSAAAREAFNGPYNVAMTHKAFAVSSRGAWGMSSSAGSTRDAVQTALADCEARRESYTPHCVPVNLDGQWVMPPRER